MHLGYLPTGAGSSTYSLSPTGSAWAGCAPFRQCLWRCHGSPRVQCSPPPSRGDGGRPQLLCTPQLGASLAVFPVQQPVFPSLGISNSWMSWSLVHLGTLRPFIPQLWLVSLLSCCPAPEHRGPKGKGPVGKGSCPSLVGSTTSWEKGSMNSCNKGSWAWSNSFRAGDKTGATENILAHVP